MIRFLLIIIFISVSLSNDISFPDIHSNQQRSTCEDIEYDYDQLHSGIYTHCEENQDCIAVWGDCGVGLGGCHYAVNVESYNQDAINELVDLWIDGDCMEWVCDCLDLPDAACNSEGYCELTYCSEPNPAGCFETGCSDGYECIDDPQYCVPSWCGCDELWGEWFCTEDCNGGTCFAIESTLGDINNDGYINVLDVVQLINFILEIDSPTDNQFIAADYNLDGVLNVLDVVTLVNAILNPADSIQVNSGTSYGECGGYCINELEIDNGNAEFIAEAWYQSNEYPTLVIEDQLSEIAWSQIVDLIDFDYFLSLDNMYGCPDCADGGAEWIEIIINGTVKQVTFDAYSEVEGIEELTLLLRELRFNYWEQMFSQDQLPDECYLDPEPGPCFAAIPMYFYNTETEQCEQFIWGGCMGVVPFQSLSECISTCE